MNSTDWKGGKALLQHATDLGVSCFDTALAQLLAMALPLSRGLGAKPMEHGAPLAAEDSPLTAVATSLDVSAGQVALAWLLHISPNVIVIPCTTKTAHLEQNISARDIELTSSQMDTLNLLNAPS